MEEIIASYLVQKGICQLPSIGKLKRESGFAVTDVVSKEILPPGINYKLYPDDGDLTEGLIEYTAEKKKVNLQEAKRQLEGWCSDASKRLNENQTIFFSAIGNLRKEEENIGLFPEGSHFSLIPVKSMRVIHENDSHRVIVGDTETNSHEMKEFFQNGEAKEKVQWLKPSLILFSIAIILYLLYLTTGGFGNHLHPTDPPPTYLSK